MSTIRLTTMSVAPRPATERETAERSTPGRQAEPPPRISPGHLPGQTAAHSLHLDAAR